MYTTYPRQANDVERVNGSKWITLIERVSEIDRMTLVLTYTFCSVANFFSLHISWLVAGIFFHSSLENRFQYNAKKAKKRHTETDKKGKNDQRTASTKEFHFFGEETRGKKTQHNTWFIGGSQRWLHMAADIIFMYSCRNLRSIDERKTKRNKQWQQNNERVTCYIHIHSFSFSISRSPPLYLSLLTASHAMTSNGNGELQFFWACFGVFLVIGQSTIKLKNNDILQNSSNNKEKTPYTHTVSLSLP